MASGGKSIDDIEIEYNVHKELLLDMLTATDVLDYLVSNGTLTCMSLVGCSVPKSIYTLHIRVKIHNVASCLMIHKELGSALF